MREMRRALANGWLLHNSLFYRPQLLCNSGTLVRFEARSNRLTSALLAHAKRTPKCRRNSALRPSTLPAYWFGRREGPFFGPKQSRPSSNAMDRIASFALKSFTWADSCGEGEGASEEDYYAAVS